MIKFELGVYLCDSGHLSEKQIREMNLVDLRGVLSRNRANHDELVKISIQRRMLKSRVYAQNARDRHQVKMSVLKAEKTRLQEECLELQKEIELYSSCLEGIELPQLELPHC